METFTEVRDFIQQQHDLELDEPFLLSFDLLINDSSRRQSLFLAELQDDDNRRYLRVETTIAPLEQLDAEKCLRINLTQRSGYLAVGDLDGTPYIKLCENLPYRHLQADELLDVVHHIAEQGDRMERVLIEDGDVG